MSLFFGLAAERKQSRAEPTVRWHIIYEPPRKDAVFVEKSLLTYILPQPCGSDEEEKNKLRHRAWHLAQAGNPPAPNGKMIVLPFCWCAHRFGGSEQNAPNYSTRTTMPVAFCIPVNKQTVLAPGDSKTSILLGRFVRLWHAEAAAAARTNMACLSL